MPIKTNNLEDKQLKEKILNKIKESNTIIIHRHVRPDPDALGSQCGLAELIKSTFPEKKVLTAGQGIGNLKFLSDNDKPSEEDYQDALVIVTDTANIARIDGEKESQSGKDWIKIDHHPLDDSYGSVEWVNTNASSCSEMIADLWLTFPEELVMSTTAARLLYAGIVGDTNRFLYQATTPYTMQVAAELMNYNINHTALNDQLNVIKPKQARLMGYVLDQFKVDENGIGHIILTQELLDNMGLTDRDTNFVVSLPGSIEGVVVWGIFVEQTEGYFRCRLRSKGPVINTVAKNHDGGGHPLASGANAKDTDEINEILNEFISAKKDWDRSRE